MKGTFWGVLAATLGVILVAYFTGGIPLVKEGFIMGWNTFIRAIPLVIAAFVLTGQLGVLLSTEWIDRVLQKFTGFKGIAAGAIAGGLFPGPPYVFYPFISGFKDKKVPFYLFYAFIQGKLVYDVARIPMEVSLINPAVALLRNLLTLPVPLIMGYLSRRFMTEGTSSDYFKEEAN